MAKNIGKVVQAVGPIIDVRFLDEHLPELLTALVVKLDETKTLFSSGRPVIRGVLLCNHIMGMRLVETC